MISNENNNKYQISLQIIICFQFTLGINQSIPYLKVLKNIFGIHWFKSKKVS